ncbi:MAG: citramalate synthase [Deltaproteobacteria bacterium]|nr:citramalate synthase [Deltaproteobacteria bacterium]
MSNYPKVVLTEEGMRDGLQIERADIPVAGKIRLLDMLSETGLKDIAVGSFVSPRWVPQMACIDELVKGFHPKPGVSYTATALNDMGRERLRQYIPPLNDLKYQAQTAVYLCDVFAQRNINRTIAQQMARWPKVIDEAKAKSAKEAGISVSAAWGSNWTGQVSQEDRMKMLDRQYQLWDAAGIPVTKIGISDPMGWNMPDQVERQLEAIKKRWPAIKSFNLHLHNTRGMALTSSYVAMRNLDASDTMRLQPAIGGMGGCPFCGNGQSAGLAPTEDLIHMMDGMGIDTGVDLDKLIEAVWVAEELVGHPLWGHVSKGGPRPSGKKLYSMDMPFVETLDHARHFIKGAAAYKDAPSPWKETIKSPQRPETMNGDAAKSTSEQSGRWLPL